MYVLCFKLCKTCMFQTYIFKTYMFLEDVHLCFMCFIVGINFFMLFWRNTFMFLEGVHTCFMVNIKWMKWYDDNTFMFRACLFQIDWWRWWYHLRPGSGWTRLYMKIICDFWRYMIIACVFVLVIKWNVTFKYINLVFLSIMIYVL